MKFVLLSIVSLAILFSIQTIYAEELPLPEGKNVKEWEAISGALMQENRFDEAIIYLDKIIDEESDNLRALSNKAGVLIHLREFEESLKISNKILEIEPNRIPTLQNKSLALKFLGEYDEAYKTFTKILVLEPDNEDIRNARGKLLSTTPTISTNDSRYDVHILVIFRDQNENLIAVTESSNARYLPSQFTEGWWNWLSEKNHLEYNDGYEIFRLEDTTLASDDHMGMLTLERDVSGYVVNLFEVFIPLIQLEETDTATVHWTIIKK